eukprot:gene41789-51009_t
MSKNDVSYAVVRDEEAQIHIELTDQTPIENVPEPQAPPLSDTVVSNVQKKGPGEVSSEMSRNADGRRKKLNPALRSFANSQHRASGAVAEPEEVTAERQKSFVFSHGLTNEEAHKRLAQYGRNELPEKNIPKWYIFVSQLWQPMPIMIWIAVIIEAAIRNFIDMAV